MVSTPSVWKKYAKAVVAVAGFVVLVATQVVNGSVDANVIIAAGIGVLTSLGVYGVKNAA